MKDVIALFVGIGICGLLAAGLWRQHVLEQRLDAIATGVERLHSDVEGAASKISDPSDVRAIRDATLANQKLLESIAELEAKRAPPTLAEQRAKKPGINAAAVGAALKDADATGRISSALFLTQSEALARFGTPSVTLMKESIVTWIYKLDGFDKLLRLEFANGAVLSAYDR